MLGHFGFSYVGCVYLLMLFLPNYMWAKKKPKGYDPSDESKLFLAFERIGQVLVTSCALIFSDFNLVAFTWWSSWLILSFISMLIYELFWYRYFKAPTLKNFYRSFFKVPVPGASLPVAAFLLLGIYGKVIWMVIAIIILGVGHIGIHIQHARKLSG